MVRTRNGCDDEVNGDVIIDGKNTKQTHFENLYKKLVIGTLGFYLG